MTLLRQQITRRAFLAALGGLAAAAAGWVVLGKMRRRPVPRLVLGQSQTLGPGELYDVCVVGSGFAGAVVGRDLVQAGFRTVMLESGTVRGGPIEPRLSDLEVYESVGSAAYPLIATRVRIVGGTSHLWTGRCERFHPLDFERNAYTPEGAAWPIRYEEIEPYYDRAERTLRVQGGRRSRYSPPRKRDFPIRSPWWQALGLRSMLRKVGVELGESPTSRGAPGESTLRVDRDLLPQFTASPLARLIPLATATRLLLGDDGRVTGAEVKNLDGKAMIVRARAYVIACGAVETARLLLLSRSDRFPYGIGNRSDLVGRYFTEHPNLEFHGTIPGMKSLLPHELGRCHQFYEALKREGLGSALLVFQRARGRDGWLRIGATTEMRPLSTNRVKLSDNRRDGLGNPGVKLTLNYSEDDRRTLDRVRSQIRSIYARLGARDLEEESISWSHHHIGTCRMGEDPKTSVTDRNLRVHESPNLYLVGSAVFVTGGASHPTLLITALAHRLAGHLIAQLRETATAR